MVRATYPFFIQFCGILPQGMVSWSNASSCTRLHRHSMAALQNPKLLSLTGPTAFVRLLSHESHMAFLKLHPINAAAEWLKSACALPEPPHPV